MLPDLFKRLKPLYGKRIDDLWIAYQLGGPEDKQSIEEVLTIFAVKRLGIAIGDEKIVLEPPPRETMNAGEYEIGKIEYPGLAPYAFTLSRRDLLRHMFVLGPSGTGKTTFNIALLRQFLRDQLPFWCVDFKRNYRCLLNDPFADELIVLTVGRHTTPLRLNMLRPPSGVEQSEWVEALADIISVAYLLMQGARNVLKEALLSASTNRGGQATLRDALDHLKIQLVSARSGSRRYGWLESSYRSIEELTKGALGQALNANDAMSFETLLRGPVVFELQGLGEDQKKCFCLYLLQAELLLRKHQPDEREVLRHVLVFDEAHNVFRQGSMGDLERALKTRARNSRVRSRDCQRHATSGRRRFVSLPTAASNSSCVRTTPKTSTLQANSYKLMHAGCPKFRWAKGSRAYRYGTTSRSSLRFAEQPLKNKIVSEELVRHRYTQWQSRNSPPVSNDSVSDPNARTAAIVAEAAQQTESVPSSVASFGGITEKEHALLADIAREPISTTTQRYDRLGWNPKVGTSTNKGLLSRGLVEFELVNTTKAVTKILRLTPPAIVYLRSRGVACALQHVSAAHEYWRHQLTQALRRLGYTVTNEYPVTGGRVDVRATKNGTVVYGEIETGKHDPAGTIRKCAVLDGRVIILFTTNEARRAHATQAIRSALCSCVPTTFHDCRLSWG